MPFLSVRPSVAGVAASTILAALAVVPYATGAKAQNQHKPAVVQRPAPVQRAPVQRPVPQVQRVAPRVATPHPAPQVHIAPAIVQHGNQNFHAVNPNLQHVNPNLQHVNPNLQRVNPNVQHVNPNLQHVNPNVQHVNPNAQKFNPNLVQQKGGVPLQGANALKRGPGNPVFNPVGLRAGPGGLQQVRPAFPAVNINNRFWPIFKGPRYMWVGGYRRFFVPVGVLGVALIGGSYWYPDGYVSMAGPACTGLTPDGCQLQWRMVDFQDGGGEPQCVLYCPQAGPPPAQFVTLPPPPPQPVDGACQVTIFSDNNFAGASAPTGDSQPNLSQTGWRNEVASIQVQAGTWDFFSDENFGGESLRLTAGPYPTLAPEWTKRIGSFMCVQPGAPGA